MSPAEQLLRQAQQLADQERKIAELECQQAETNTQVAALVDGENYFAIIGYGNLFGMRIDRRSSSELGKLAAAICHEKKPGNQFSTTPKFRKG